MRMILLFMALTLNVNAVQGPCARKLLATGDRAFDTQQFTMYIEMLVDEGVVALSDLEPFFKSLKKGKLLNPVPNQTINKNFTLHHGEFEKILSENKLDLIAIKKWSNEFFKKNKTVEAEKTKAAADAKALPVYTAFNGGMFYLYKDPVLGEVYRILKPGGRLNRDEDWEEYVWPLNPLTDRNGDVLTVGDQFVYPPSNFRISKNAGPRYECVKLGESIDLPTNDDYLKLLSYFEYDKENYVKSGSGLKEHRLKEFHDLFSKLPQLKSYKLWTSSVLLENGGTGFYFHPWTAEIYRGGGSYEVICIGKFKR